MCRKWEEILKLFQHLVMYIYIQNVTLKLYSLSTNTLNVSLISTICPHRSRHHSLFHPLATMRHRTGGGICNSGSFTEFHIHIRNVDEAVVNMQGNLSILMGDDNENLIITVATKDISTVNCETGCSENKGSLPKRDRKCLKAKSEDFFMVLGTKNKWKENNNLIVYHQNIRSLNKKKDEISIMLQEIKEKPHLICLSEHHIRKEESLDFTLPDYK